MPELQPVNATISPEDQSATLYQAENQAKIAVDFVQDMLNESDMEEDDGKQLSEVAHEARDAYVQAASQSNEFAKQHMDELHDAAIKEAAQRVTDVFADSGHGST